MPSSTTSSPLPEATVVAVGPGAPNKEGKVVPTSVKAGDRVLLPGWGGNSIKLGEEVSTCLFHASSTIFLFYQLLSTLDLLVMPFPFFFNTF